MSSPKQLLGPLPIVRHIFTISCGMTAKQFFHLLQMFRVRVLVDTRQNRTYPWARFAFGPDLADLCELLGIKYLLISDLMPTEDLRRQLAAGEKRRNDQSWTTFLQGYVNLIGKHRKFLAEGKPTRELIFGDLDGIAFMCSCQHPDDCHRQVIAGVLQKHVLGLEVKHLTPDLIGGRKPTRKSPRRRLKAEIPAAGLTPSS